MQGAVFLRLTEGVIFVSMSLNVAEEVCPPLNGFIEVEALSEGRNLIDERSRFIRSLDAVVTCAIIAFGLAHPLAQSIYVGV